MANYSDDVLDLGSWCILRMASAETLSVCERLRDAGISAWTPVERQLRRTPRTRDPYDRETAILPSYAFCHVEHLSDLLRLASVPNKDVPRFTVFRHNGGIPLIADNQLAALREEEDRLAMVYEKARRKGVKGPTFEEGASVRTASGPFEGLTGVVEDQAGQFTLVSFAGFHSPIKIASLLLEPDAVSGELSDAA